MALLLSPTGTRAEITVAEWRTLNSDEREIFLVWLAGAIVGFTWSNAMLENLDPGGERVFCLPRRLALTADQAQAIMEDHDDRLQAEERTPDTMPIGLLLTFALRDVFPCEPD